MSFFLVLREFVIAPFSKVTSLIVSVYCEKEIKEMLEISRVSRFFMILDLFKSLVFWFIEPRALFKLRYEV